MPKFSDNIVALSINFIRSVEAELGSLGQEKVFAMLDAFDPELRDDMLMSLFVHGDSFPVTVHLKKNPNWQNYQKITAIKEIRVATGYGLKEAKDVVDLADLSQVSSLTLRNFEARMTLATGLAGTGYELA